MTFQEIKAAQKKFIDFLPKPLPEWLTGVGIGVNPDRTYILRVNVLSKDDIDKAELYIKNNDITVPYVIEVTGIITAF